MIFSADLDRTLIFSQKRLAVGTNVIPVEYRHGEPFGFMTPAALRLLQGLQQQTVCFVNTLRGLEQANRVCFVADGKCRYLALQNGLYLYRNGKEDRDWSIYVRNTVADLPLSLSQCAVQILAELPGIECLSKQYEYLAVFFVDVSAFNQSLCDTLAQELARSGWALMRQRKKLYLFPLAIHKGAVLNRVRILENGDYTIGFGDSAFDLPMLQACDSAWSLMDCELYGTEWGFPMRFSSAPAQAGTEEILLKIFTSLGEI